MTHRELAEVLGTYRDMEAPLVELGRFSAEPAEKPRPVAPPPVAPPLVTNTPLPPYWPLYLWLAILLIFLGYLVLSAVHLSAIGYSRDGYLHVRQQSR